MVVTKEQLIRDFPGMMDALHAELADALAKLAFCVVDNGQHEATYREQAGKLRWRLDQAWAVYRELPALPYEVVPPELLARFGPEAADAWWRARQGWGEAIINGRTFPPRRIDSSVRRAADGIGRSAVDAFASGFVMIQGRKPFSTDDVPCPHCPAGRGQDCLGGVVHPERTAAAVRAANGSGGW